jgi:histamine-gated chloride channel
MEFAVVNIYMGPVATKVMKGYSDENIAESSDFKCEEHRPSTVPSLPQYDTFSCNGREIALEIDREYKILP